MMKKFFLVALIFSFIFFMFGAAYAEIVATIVARSNQEQISRLKAWLVRVIPEQNMKVLDFETRQAKAVLSNSGIEFIPAVIFEPPLSEEESHLLIQNFNLSYAGGHAFIPKDSLKKSTVLELYKRKRIPRRLDIFSMSLCPYSSHAERRLINYIRAHNLDIDLKLHYLVTLQDGRFNSLHGLKELNENRRRIIIQKYWPDKFFDYLLLRQNNPHRKIFRRLGIEYAQAKKKMPEAETLLMQGYRLTKDLEISASPTFLWENKFLVNSLEQLSALSPFNQKGKIEDLSAPVKGLLKMAMFTSSKCRACYKVKEEFLPGIIEKYKGLFEVTYYDIDQPDNFKYLMEMEEKYGILEQGSVPKIFVGDNVLIGLNQIQNNLENILLKSIEEDKKDLPLKKAEVKENILPEKIVNLFKTFTAGTVLLAGLVDGINPCAFTTLIFFLSFLSFAGYKKREVLYIGTFFIVAVFLTYFLLGLGAFKFILQLRFYSKISELFYYAVGILVLVLGVINLYDFFRFRKTKKIEDIKLKLPQAIKWRIQSIIGKGYRKEGKDKEEAANLSRLIFLSLVTGFIVSILESLCTGQVYLPTITFITQVPGLRVKAVFYLFLYNLMFIIPLLVIFMLAICGLTSERFSKFAQRHLAKIKLATAVFLFSMFFLLWKLR